MADPVRQSIRPRALALTLMLITACSPAGETTSPEQARPEPPTTEAPLSAEAGTTPEGRPLHLIGCDPVEPEVEIVCEAYNLVRRHYVDQVTDEELARAAARGLEALDDATSRTELVCPAPASQHDPERFLAQPGRRTGPVLCPLRLLDHAGGGALDRLQRPPQRGLL